MTCLDDCHLFPVIICESIRFLLVLVFMILQMLVKVIFWHDTVVLGVYILVPSCLVKSLSVFSLTSSLVNVLVPFAWFLV